MKTPCPNLRASARCALLMLVAVAAQAANVPAPGASKPPPLHAATAIQLQERGAILPEDFDGPKLDETRWRVWQQTPERTTVAQKDGRLEITARGLTRMEGLSGLVTAKYKDVVLVGEMDIRSRGRTPHRLCLHLCGGDAPRSPDHWVEVQMTDLGETARFAPHASLPPGMNRRVGQFIELPHPAGQGFLCRITLNADTNIAELSVQTPGGWKRVCEPLELPLRTIHTEVKLNAQTPSDDPAETSSAAWFDNVRIYPRPENHHVAVRLVQPDGSPVWFREGWPPSITDAAGRTRPITDLEVQLRTTDGKVVAVARTEEFGTYLLPLRQAPWEVYPVAAEIQVVLDGAPLGPPQKIACHGVEGLYPDDVYQVVMQ